MRRPSPTLVIAGLWGGPAVARSLIHGQARRTYLAQDEPPPGTGHQCVVAGTAVLAKK